MKKGLLYKNECTPSESIYFPYFSERDCVRKENRTSHKLSSLWKMATTSSPVSIPLTEYFSKQTSHFSKTLIFGLLKVSVAEWLHGNLG